MGRFAPPLYSSLAVLTKVLSLALLPPVSPKTFGASPPHVTPQQKPNAAEVCEKTPQRIEDAAKLRNSAGIGASGASAYARWVTAAGGLAERLGSGLRAV